jgi:sugar phosphate isomerase/epimerase
VRPGLQLYSLRDAMSASVPDTLERVASIGYGEVEFAGYLGHGPAEIRHFLAGAGLAAPSAHVDAVSARDNPQAAIDTTLEAGHACAVIAWIPQHLRQGADDWRGWAETLNRFGAACREAGLQFAYHNHDFEFAPQEDGLVPFDHLLNACDASLVGFELDIYWTRRAGADAGALLAAHPGRFPLCHAKDMGSDGAMVSVGAGQIDFPALLNSPDGRGFEHVYAEHDNPPDPWSFARDSHAALSRILGQAP